MFKLSVGDLIGFQTEHPFHGNVMRVTEVGNGMFQAEGVKGELSHYGGDESVAVILKPVKTIVQELDGGNDE